ncbi:Fpg/Nei family DNA glycosylase [Egicoccus sp. AB-alg6-2]|uniref:Fpg/Nei family DNA glycosylase n=1 Tax=Egicoccus sp. AB-alg6-2 TaxID=3242692 RepID=UPI00359E7CE8
MPEGHLLHHLARQHRDGLLGAREVSSPQGRFDAAAITGVLEGVEAHGKHLFHGWSDGMVVHVHLGKQGLFVHHDIPPPAPRPQVRMRVVGPRLASDLIAPLLCEVVDEAGQEAVVAGLGPDPLRADADATVALSALRATTSPIGAALLDQSRISGIGNVLRAEVLHLVGIDGERPASALSDADAEGLWQALVDLMRRSAEAGEIPKTVYRRERCTLHQAPVHTLTIGGRTFYRCASTPLASPRLRSP